MNNDKTWQRISTVVIPKFCSWDGHVNRVSLIAHSDVLNRPGKKVDFNRVFRFIIATMQRFLIWFGTRFRRCMPGWRSHHCNNSPRPPRAETSFRCLRCYWHCSPVSGSSVAAGTRAPSWGGSTARTAPTRRNWPRPRTGSGCSLPSSRRRHLRALARLIIFV